LTDENTNLKEKLQESKDAKTQAEQTIADQKQEIARLKQPTDQDDRCTTRPTRRNF
jgi:hypothetical protein